MAMTLALQRARARLRIREGGPSTAKPATGYVEAGSDFQPIEEVAGEAVSGNAYWYRIDADHYVWSGASAPAPAPGATASMNVSYRTDVPGAIAVLSDAERDDIFNPITGFFETKPTGAVILPEGWEDANIVTIQTPIFTAIGHSTLRVHKRAAKAFKNVFAKIEAAALTDRILHCDGTFVPRHKGWNPKRSLSSHSWGIAIDLNARWNGYGNAPAPLGAIGCTRDLIPIFASEGFAWGGYFTPDAFRDGMHFELARRDPLLDA